MAGHEGTLLGQNLISLSLAGSVTLARDETEARNGWISIIALTLFWAIGVLVPPAFRVA
jgi:hypothetical protein